MEMDQAGVTAWGVQGIGPGSGGPGMFTLKWVGGVVDMSCGD